MSWGRSGGVPGFADECSTPGAQQYGQRVVVVVAHRQIGLTIMFEVRCNHAVSTTACCETGVVIDVGLGRTWKRCGEDPNKCQEEVDSARET